MILRFLLCIPITLILIGCSSKKGDINKMSEEVEVLELIVPKDTINSPVSRWKKLQVKGTKLCDSRGDSIQLRGISSHGLQYPGAANITEKNICYLAEKWKCNVFRIVITAEDEGGGYYRNPTHKYRYLENTVKWCGESGIYCIITWGVLNPGNPQDSIYRNHYFPDKGKHIDMAKDFFTYCSRRFKKQKHVIYELCSEPNSRNYDGKNFKKQEHVKHLDGLKYGSIPLDSLNWWKGLVEPYCQEMIKVIRDNGDLAVIICGSPNYSQSPDIERARDFLDKNKNIMFGLNVYSDNRTEIIDKNGDTIKLDLKNKIYTKDLESISKHLPIFIINFNTNDKTGWHENAFNDKLSDDWLEFFYGKKISWCNQSFASKAEGGGCCILNWNSGDISKEEKKWHKDTTIFSRSGKYICEKLNDYHVMDSINATMK